MGVSFDDEDRVMHPGMLYVVTQSCYSHIGCHSVNDPFFVVGALRDTFYVLHKQGIDKLNEKLLLKLFRLTLSNAFPVMDAS
jgi:hypothetical protein